jgi:hypothetical protein
MQRIKKIGVLQTSKVVSAVIFLLMLVFSIPIFYLEIGGGYDVFQLTILTIITSVLGFVCTAITCMMYNFVAKYLGGIEVYFEDL